MRRRANVRRSAAALGRRALGWCVAAAERAPLLLVLGALLLTGLGLAYVAGRLTINTDTVDMIADDVPFRRHDEAFHRAFPRFRDTIVAVIDGPTPEHVDDAAERLAAGLRARDGLFRDVYLPGGEPFFERYGLLFMEADALAALADRLAGAQPLLAALAEDPSLRGFAEVLDLALGRGAGGPGQADAIGHLLGDAAGVVEAAAAGRPLALSWQGLIGGIGLGDGGAAMRFVVVQPELDYGSLKPAAAPIAEIRRQAMALGIDAGQGLRLRLTGTAALDHEELESVQLGGQTAGLLSLGLVTALLVWGLRSTRLVVATLATLLMGLVWTAAFATLAIGHLNLLSVAFAVLFVGLGVDFAIHTCLRYREEAAADRSGALRRAALGVGGALTLSAASAAAGFYAFLPTDYRGLAELGLISGTGMFIALAASLTVLPALIVLAPPGVRATAVGSGSGSSALAGIVRRWGRAVLVVSTLLGVAGLAALPFVRFDVDPINLMDPEAESVTTFRDLARDPDTSPYTVDVLAPSLGDAERLAERLRALPEVGRALMLADFVPDDQDEKLAIIDEVALFLGPVLGSGAAAIPPPDDAARRVAVERLRDRLEATADDDAGGPLAAPAARLLAALEDYAERTGLSGVALADLEGRLTGYLPRTLARLDAALSPTEPVGLDDLPPELRGRWLAADGRSARVEVSPAGDMGDPRALARFAGAVQGVAPAATGTPIIVTEAGRAVVTAFVQASVLALALIVLILLVALRRVIDTALVLAPLALAALMTVGASVVLGLPFNFANVIVLPLILGLGVSAGVHFVVRRRERGDDGDVLATSTPRAVLFSALTTVASFGSLAVSGHQGMTSMGQFLTLGIGFTLLAAIVVLPCLMAEVGAWRRPAAADGGGAIRP